MGHSARTIRGPFEGVAAQRERTWRAAVAGESVEAEVQAVEYAALLKGAGISPQRIRHEI